MAGEVGQVDAVQDAARLAVEIQPRLGMLVVEIPERLERFGEALAGRVALVGREHADDEHVLRQPELLARLPLVSGLKMVVSTACGT